MLAIISDLHLQHTSDDVIRYKGEGGGVVECGVRRNVSPGALRRWFAMIHDAVLRHHVDEVELVFAGDIFEFHRTPLWFMDNPSEARPTRDDTGDDVPGNPLRQKSHAILDAIEVDNRQFFRVLARFVRDGAYEVRDTAMHLPTGTRISVHYLPGNHDRLANGWASLRSRVRALLSMEPDGSPFPHEIRRKNARTQSGYGVVIRHGHEYDRWNYAGDCHDATLASDDIYMKPSIGDYMTIDVATRCAMAFRAFYAVELRTPGAAGDRYRKLYMALLEFDDVRPGHALFDYLAQQRSKLGGDPLQLLRPVIRDVYSAACRDPFFLAESARLNVLSWFSDPISTVVIKGIDLLPSKWAVALPFAWPFKAAEGDPKPAELAQNEPGLRDGSIDTIVAGHTHHPDHVPIRGRRRRSVDSFFVDSGTWRSSILYGAGERFGRILGHTAVFCYAQAEHKRDNGDRRRFETWTGHAASGKSGPYAEPRGLLRTATHQLRFVRLYVDQAASEGPAPQEAMQLAIKFGVDGKARRWDVEGVRPGDVLQLTGVAPVPLFADLDGELWFHGTRVASRMFDADVPLPWAVHLLRRERTRPESAKVGSEEPTRRKRNDAPADYALGSGECSIHGPSGLTLRMQWRVEATEVPVQPAVVEPVRQTIAQRETAPSLAGRARASGTFRKAYKIREDPERM